MNKKAVLVVGMTVFSFSFGVNAEEVSDAYKIAKGGRLYDKWFAENGSNKPKSPNPVYPATGKYYGKKASDWRCKECHGWDYQGASGAYKSGKHYTGIKGISAMSGADPQLIEKILSDSNHNYSDSMLSKDDRSALALFVAKGQIDMDQYIDRKSKQVKGNSEKGRVYYQTVCATCHGLDGKGEDTPPLGKLTNKNPWEVMHKIAYGQPKWEMPALSGLDIQVTADITAYMQKHLPK